MLHGPFACKVQQRSHDRRLALSGGGGRWKAGAKGGRLGGKPERPYFGMVGNMNSLFKGSNEKFPATKNGKVPQDVSPTSEDLEDKMSVGSIKNDA